MCELKRNENIEVLRCLLMGLIVSHHSFVYGVFSSVHSWWTVLFTTLICWHVDAFLSISGWFGIKFSWMKVLRLYGVIIFYSSLSMIYTLAFEETGFSWQNVRITGGWFGNTYLGLLFFAPFLNAGVDYLLSRKGESGGSPLRVWGLFAVLITLSWLPSHGMTAMEPGGVDGHSLILFVFVYVTVRLLRATLVDSKYFTMKRLIFGFVGFIGMFLIFGLIDFVSVRMGTGHLVGIGRVFASYDAPHVWVMAICVLLFFIQYIRVPSWLGKIAAFCGPSMFGVYLLHDTTSFGHLIFQQPEAWLATHTGLHPILVVSLAALFTFVVCLSVDLLRRGCVSFFKHSIKNCLIEL